MIRDKIDKSVTFLCQLTGKQYFWSINGGKHRLYLPNIQGVKEISPRLNQSEFQQWIEGFIEGYREGISKQSTST